MIYFDHIVDGIFVGTCPVSTVDIQRLGQAGISAVLNLQTDRDFAAVGINWPALERHYHQRSIATYRYPIVDFDDQHLFQRIADGAQLLDEITDTHSRIYVHCTAGQQRSPSIVIAWLAWNQGKGIEKAIQTVIQARLCDPPLHVLREVDSVRSETAG